MRTKKDKINKKREPFKIEITDIVILLICITVFGIALISFYPGLLTSDCVDQIAQAKNNIYRPSHPILHSFIIGNLTKLGGIWVPALFQILVFSFIWTYLCKKLRKYNSSNKNKIAQIIITFLICICPLNFMYSITLWKDILYSYAILLVLGLIFIGIKEKYKYTIFQIVLIALSCVSVMKLRRNGVPIGFFMFVILLFLNVVKNKSLKDFIKFIVSFIVIYCLACIPEWTVEQIKPVTGGSILNTSKVYCMGKLLNSDIQLEDDEREFLDTILDVEEWKEGYDYFSGSNIFFNGHFDNSILMTDEAQQKFDTIFYKYAKQRKTEVAKHYLAINSIWWSIKELGPMHGIILNNGSVSEMSGGIYDTTPKFEKGFSILVKIIFKTWNSTLLYNITYRPATALYVSTILTFAIIIVERKNKFRGRIAYLLMLFPMFLNIGTYVLLISSQDQRYFYPNFMTEYFLIILCATIFIKKPKVSEENAIEVNRDNPKVLVIVPAYNEEKSIKDVIQDIYGQDIENCDVIVINDGSTDNTLREAQKTKAIVIDSPNNLGIGGAVQTGYLYAKKNNYDIAIQIDGDGQHNPKYIEKLISKIKEGYDLVIGSRFIVKTSYDQTFSRMLGIKIISGIIKLMTGKKIYDTTSGFRAAGKRVINEFAEDYPYDYPEPCTNMHVLKKNYKVAEVSVEMKKRENGKSSISKVKSVVYMLKVSLFLIIKGFID